MLFITGFILFLSSILQGAVGFAFGLFAIPLLVWTGATLSQAVTLVTVSAFVQVLIATYQLRKEIRWQQVIPATFIRYLTLPLGIILLLTIDTLDRDLMKQILGLIILIVLAIQIFWKVQPQQQLHPKWMLLAFSGSGIMQGMSAMGGPPAVLWVMAHPWSSKQTRAFLLTLFLLMAPFQILILYFSTGSLIIDSLWYGFIFAPFVALGSMGGVRIGNQIAKPMLRRIAFSILFITALISVTAPFFS